ncbi:hypothetical protein ASF70_12990 [Rhizobium sp. Leaf321]|nr:hypothetical protein ASF70_12990 [Rhizobium sp. Leaf321]
MIHNSLEWPADELLKFQEKIAALPHDLFGIATTDDNPTFFVINRSFVDAVEKSIHQLIEDMAGFLYFLMYPGSSAMTQ